MAPGRYPSGVVWIFFAALLFHAPGQRGLDPPDAAPRSRLEKGRIVYQLGDSVFAFRLSKGAWKDLPDGAYLRREQGDWLVTIATARSVRYEDIIEAQSRAVGALMAEAEAACPAAGQCRLHPGVWKRFDRFAWWDAAAGEVKLLLRLRARQVVAGRRDARDHTARLVAHLIERGRLDRSGALQP
jgi:hypothetical protein